MSKIDRRLIIDASEVGEFLYCAKAWYLKRCGEKPRGPQLDDGIVFHKDHAKTVSRSARLRQAGVWIGLIGIILLVVLALILTAR